MSNPSRDIELSIDGQRFHGAGKITPKAGKAGAFLAVAGAVQGLSAGGWLERRGVGPGAKFVLTPAARSAAHNSEAPAHVH
jgi:hypothetical protein